MIQKRKNLHLNTTAMTLCLCRSADCTSIKNPAHSL